MTFAIFRCCEYKRENQTPRVLALVLMFRDPRDGRLVVSVRTADDLPLAPSKMGFKTKHFVRGCEVSILPETEAFEFLTEFDRYLAENVENSRTHSI